MTANRCPFTPGDRIRCIDPLPSVLKKGQTYTVGLPLEDQPTTYLVTLRELRGRLFHPNRFVRVKE